MKTKENEIKLTAYQLFQIKKEQESWTIISEKVDINWTADFIDTNKANLDWKALSFNDSLPWSIELIQQFNDLWDWHALSFIIADENYFERNDFDSLLLRYSDKLDWTVICQGTNLNINHFTNYAEYIHWDTLSSNSRFTWSENFVNEYIDEINWKVFTECLATVKTSSVVQNACRKKVLDLYAHKLDFGILSANDFLNFTPEIIERYKNRWNWAELINNPSVDWDETMLKKYNKYISIIPFKDVKVSFMWARLIEHDAEIEMLLVLL